MLTKEQELLATCYGEMQRLWISSKFISFQKKRLREESLLENEYNEIEILDARMEGESFIFREVINFIKREIILSGIPEDFLKDHDII